MIGSCGVFQFSSGFGLMMIQVGSKRHTDMNFGEIISLLPPQTRGVVLRMESDWRKIINDEAAVSFNKIFLEEFILPNFTDINVHDRTSRNDEITYRCRRDLVCRQIGLKEKAPLELSLQLETIKNEWDAYTVGYP